MPPVDEQEYKRLKRQADDARTSRDKAQGQLDAAMHTLKEEFGCDDLDSANQMLESLDKDADKAEKEYDKAKAAFEEEWAGKLGEKE